MALHVAEADDLVGALLAVFIFRSMTVVGFDRLLELDQLAMADVSFVQAVAEARHDAAQVSALLALVHVGPVHRGVSLPLE